MINNNKNTGFDAFFKAVTSSPEFKSAVTKDWKNDSMETLEETIKKMESGVEKAADMMKTFNEKFGTDEAKMAGNAVTLDGKNPPPKTGNASDENKAPAIEVQHFERKPGKPFGFEAVAGMDALKTELQESFIKPLRFKFLVEKLQKESKNSPLEKGELEGVLSQKSEQTPPTLPLSGEE